MTVSNLSIGISSDVLPYTHTGLGPVETPSPASFCHLSDGDELFVV